MKLQRRAVLLPLSALLLSLTRCPDGDESPSTSATELQEALEINAGRRLHHGVDRGCGSLASRPGGAREG